MYAHDMGVNNNIEPILTSEYALIHMQPKEGYIYNVYTYTQIKASLSDHGKINFSYLK